MESSKSFFDAIFFDMDGLMVDSEPQWFVSEIEVTKPFGYTWLEEDQVACLGGPLTRVGQYMFDKCGQVESPHFFIQELIRVQAEKMRGNTPTMPGAVELVKDLQVNGVKTALVSASPRPIVDAVLNGLSKNYYQFSISASDVSRSKPFPDPYLLAADKLKVEISECIVLEDSATGVASATAAGAYVVAVPHLVPIEEASRRIVVKTLENVSISLLIEKLNR